MPDIEASLKIFGQLIGLLGADGSIQWVWFSDPKKQILGSAGDSSIGLAHHRQYLGQLIRSLKGENPADADAAFTAGYSWVPLNDGDVQVGFAWNDGDAELEVGFGAKANFSAGAQAIDLSVLAKLLKIQDGDIVPLISDVVFSGAFPVPDFLSSIVLKGETKPLSVEIDVTNKESGASAQRALKFPATPAQDPAVFGWDCARIALFVLEAWIHDNAKGGDNAFTRIDHHLFPMFGEPVQPNISPFPLFGNDNMGKPVNFQPWRDSVLNMSGGGAGALAFLWHLRGLLTGNEQSDFLKGSLFMPLVSGAPGGAPPFSPASFTGTYDPKTAAAGVYIGITDDTPNLYTLVIDVVSGSNNYLRLPLAQLSGTTLSRPNPPSAAALDTFLSNALPPQSGLTAAKVGGNWVISFSSTLTGTGVTFLDGTYNFEAVMSSPVRFQVRSPKLPIDIALPPDSIPAPPSPAVLITSLVNWVISAIPSTGSAGKLKPVAMELSTFLAAEMNTLGSGKIGALLTAIGKTLASGLAYEIKKPPFDLTVGLANGTTDNYFHITAGTSYGPFSADQIPNFPISIGKLSATLDLAVDQPGNPLHGFTLGFDDLRLGDAKGGASGIIGSLIPNLKQAPGFTLKFAWDTAKGAQISGGGKVPIQLTLGPLSLNQLLVDATNSSLTIGINLNFQLAVITINTYELGLKFDYKSNLPTPTLHGLGLSFDGGGIKLSGLFLNNGGDYIGAASVSVENLFALSAIGGYKLLQQPGKKDTPSLFIFASLVAPLGGPPFFFITGIAGGFGFNRALPPMTLMSQHPFILIMSGQINVGSDPKSGMGDLTQLDDPKTGFAPKLGDYWIAAGIQFTSFGFIHGKVLVAVAFGHDFSLNLLGIASFGINPLAYFEIDILVTVDQEKFLLVAGVSKNSYIVHPDLFNLSGDFGLGVWHGGEHAGDFLLSIGGFHPYFKAPDYYPQLNRVSVKSTLWGFVHFSVECFFACTPQALMAGASVSLSAKFAGIAAGLDVYLDVFIQWDPFFILATMGVSVWFEFMGRHEIGVDLQIHTPKFGGTATIHLFIVSFDIVFGEDVTPPPPPPVFEFVTKRLGVPAKTWNGKGASLALYNTDAAAGLVQVLFDTGRTTGDKADGTKAQEGTDPKKPVKVAPEFSFTARTHLPFLESDGDLGGGPLSALEGRVNLPLCGLADLESVFAVQLYNATEKHDIKIPVGDITRSTDLFPYANFNHEPLPVAQADHDSAREAVAQIDTSKPSLPLTDGLSFKLLAQPQPANQKTMVGPEEELSDVKEDYPLPFGWPPNVPQVTVGNKSKLQFAPTGASASQKVAQLRPKKVKDRRMRALDQMKSRVKNPWQIGLTTSQFNRVLRSAVFTTTVASPATNIPVMTPPASPQRRKELASVSMRILAPHAAVTPVRTSVRAAAITKSSPVSFKRLSSVAVRAGSTNVSKSPDAFVSFLPGQTAHLNITGNVSAPQGMLTFTGAQTVRAMFLTAFGELVSDQYVSGNQRVPLPPRARRIALIGEGALAGAPASLGSVGIEPATSLFAVSRKEFAGHGCVMQMQSGILKNVDHGDTLNGSDILPFVKNASVFFPAPQRVSCLVFALTPAVPSPASAPSQIRWRALNATLGTLKTVATPDLAYFVMDIAGREAWSLDIEVGTDWQLTAVVMANMLSGNALTALRASGRSNFVNDHFVQPDSQVPTTVTLELVNG